MSAVTTFNIQASRAGVAAFADQFEAHCEPAGVPMAVVRAFQVAFDEVLTNVVDYGLKGDPGGRIYVHLQIDDDAVHADVVDNGPAFDPLSDSALPDLDLEIDDRPIGGLGVHLVRTLMDEVGYHYADGQNHLSLLKRFHRTSQGGSTHAEGS